MPSISIQKSSSLPSVRVARANLKITSMPSMRKQSITLHAKGRGNDVENNVKNQDDAYLER